MKLERIEKTKIAQIESMAESIHFSFANLDPKLKQALEQLIDLIKEEKNSREMLREKAWALANRI